MSGARARARSCRAASSRCSPSPACCARAHRFILLDEPTEGLAPVIVQRIGDVLVALKKRGMTILLVEQNFRFAKKGGRPLLPHGGRAYGELVPRARARCAHGRTSRSSWGIGHHEHHFRHSHPCPLRPDPHRPDQRLLLCHAQPWPCGDLRPAAGHQLRPWRAIHAGRFRGLPAPDLCGHRLLAGPHPGASDRRRSSRS